MMAANPLKPPALPALVPPPVADLPPLMSISQVEPVIQSAPTVTRPSKAPGVMASIMPSLFVKSASKRRRAIIVVTGLILTFVVGIVAVMIFSRATH
jgi:hypothetical protein